MDMGWTVALVMFGVCCGILIREAVGWDNSRRPGKILVEDFDDDHFNTLRELADRNAVQDRLEEAVRQGRCSPNART